MIIVLNDNAWSIDKNVGAIAEYFHKHDVHEPDVSRSLHDRAAGLLERFGGKAVRHVARQGGRGGEGTSSGAGCMFEEFGHQLLRADRWA